MPYEQNDAQIRDSRAQRAGRRGAATRAKKTAKRATFRRFNDGLSRRIAALDWTSIGAALENDGYARAAQVLSGEDCRALIAMYGQDERFRSRVDMARHRFGQGDYAYFAAPLPRVVAILRRELYRRLAPLANRMAEALGRPADYPRDLAAYTKLCHGAGQTRPTPLLLRYEKGGYNRLHRDLYGTLAFPLQVTILLSRPDTDFTGGEFLLLEDRPRQQARADAIALAQGEMIVFPVRERPVRSNDRFVRAVMRHGVSRVRSGRRYALGVIFHDAA
jgi:hypothetical protein